MVMVGRKGGGISPPKTIPGMKCSHRSTWAAKRPWKGPISCLKGPIRTRLGKFKSPRKTKDKLEKGERWNGRGGSERRGSEPTQTDTRFEKLMPG